MLTAGPLSARLEDGALHDIRWNGVEAIRGIAWLVRDRDWGTVPARIEGMRVDQGADRFTVAFDAVTGGLRSHLRIVGDAAGLRFDGTAIPDADFETNRTGFTVLHPIDGVAGAWVRIGHADGRAEETVFPDLIAPWQPFMDIASITHRIDGAEVSCLLDGDVFEMEDQRAWSDASFKTYCRPLALAWPYVLPKGQAVRQCVTVTFRPAHHAPPRAAPMELNAPMPQIGLVIAPEEIAEALRHAPLLAEVAPQRILCHIDGTVGLDALRGFAALQAAYPAEYDLEYIAACDRPDEMARLAEAVAQSGLRLASVMVCPAVDRQSTPPGSVWPDCPPLESLYAAARAVFDVPLGGGMASYFTELNRKRPPLDLLDFVTHGTNPIVHAAGDASVMQTLEAIPHILRSALAIAQGREYRLGPTMIGMRQNPYGSRTIPNPDGRRICMAAEDPRQKTDFAAAFTAGYAAALAGFPVAAWIPAAFTGPRGIVGADGTLWPVGEVVAKLARMAGKRAAQGLAPPPSRTQPK